MASADRPDATAAAPAAADPGPDAAALDQTFTGDQLYGLRSAVAAHGSELGLAGAELADLVLVAHELAANAVRHGRASAAAPARLRLWQSDGLIWCQVADSGPGLTDLAAGIEPVSVQAANGRGLWIIRQVARSLTIETGADGTSVIATFAAPA